SGLTRVHVGRRRFVLETQGLSAVAFFEATALIILLVLFVLLRKDHPSRYLNVWVAAWALLTIKAVLELGQLTIEFPELRVLRVVLLLVVHLLFVRAVVQYAYGPRNSFFHLWPVTGAVVLLGFYFESRPVAGTPHIGWFGSGALAVTSLAAG